jgi:hypothetical protein
VGLLFLIAHIGPVKQELHPSSSYAVAGRTERQHGMQAPPP